MQSDGCTLRIVNEPAFVIKMSDQQNDWFAKSSDSLSNFLRAKCNS